MLARPYNGFYCLYSAPTSESVSHRGQAILSPPPPPPPPPPEAGQNDARGGACAPPSAQGVITQPRGTPVSSTTRALTTVTNVRQRTSGAAPCPSPHPALWTPPPTAHVRRRRPSPPPPPPRPSVPALPRSRTNSLAALFGVPIERTTLCGPTLFVYNRCLFGRIQR